ncbi:peptidoglycan-binding protein [Streptomyces sp. NPDC058989]|uniref:peptidoglycan-binding domain-containing protein n=1 Tax=Streptomyces sp. NPDC058989 TaxID=3346686 RepID=UPI0036A8A8DF
MTALPTCPHCFAPVRSDGRPTCLCAAVDAEDFDPLRVRPYVSLPDEDGGEGGGGDDSGDGGDGGHEHRAGAPWGGRGDHLDSLPGEDAAVHTAKGPLGPPGAVRDPASVAGPYSAPLMPRDSPPLIPRAGHRPGPTSRTVGSAPEEPAARASGRPAPASSRRRRALPAVLVAAGAAAAATAVLIGSDALSGGTHDRAAPPDGGPASATAAFPTGNDAPRTPSGTPSSPAAPASPSPGATGAGGPETTAQRHRTATPAPPAPTRASGSVTDSPDSQAPSTAPTGPIVLREGSSGPEVTELQGRLRQLALYSGTEDGRYDAQVRDAVSRYQRAYQVTGDPDGVYGPQTRASLEARTGEP